LAVGSKKDKFPLSRCATVSEYLMPIPDALLVSTPRGLLSTTEGTGFAMPVSLPGQEIGG
jgi:hypothetical protein